MGYATASDDSPASVPAEVTGVVVTMNQAILYRFEAAPAAVVVTLNGAVVPADRWRLSGLTLTYLSGQPGSPTIVGSDVFRIYYKWR